MRQPGRCRWLALMLLAPLGASLGARPAVASGCHVADRPALGLSIGWDVPLAGSVATTPTTAKLGRPPCSQHLPGAPPSAQADASILGAPEPPSAGAPLPSQPFARAEAPLRPRHESSVRPRPPRASGFVG